MHGPYSATVQIVDLLLIINFYTERIQVLNEFLITHISMFGPSYNYIKVAFLKWKILSITKHASH